MRKRSSRWTRRFPRTAPATRWRRWAAMLGAVRRRVTVGRSRPGLILASRPRYDPAPASRPLTWTFAPRVHMAIAVALPRVAREPRPSPARIVRLEVAPPVARSGATTGAATTPSAARPRGSREAPDRQLPARRGHAVVRSPAASTVRRTRASAPSPETAHVAREVVVRPATPRRRLDGSTPIASPALVLKESARTVHRVREERRRVEQRTAQPMTTHARPVPPPTPTGAVPGLIASPMVATSPWEDPARPSALAERAIDIPRLTDQVVEAINHRIVAQRERQGRAY